MRPGALIVTADDLRLMVYTAEPNTEDADRLALTLVLGTQTLVNQTHGGGACAPTSSATRFESGHTLDSCCLTKQISGRNV